ncbi:universal stress protein [Microvirga sp. KLBC 81]|uniref:universal stress protein n=1 Tax=Microvirga sp. KLBC 81 TaxID=1862707 RepID=UPI000D524830|nr:universal stress protein [Microvirga sp. KLBC 81]PVE23376.1 universal stress protein [Microvirga sp. KLBC 81]
MIKDVLVHLDGTSRDEERLQHAEAIASVSQAHVTGLFTNLLPDVPLIAPMDAGAAAAEILVSLTEEAKGTGDVLQRKLADRMARFSVPNEIRRIDGTSGEISNEAATEARWADLFIMSRPYDANGSEQWNSLFEAVLFEGGRSVLVVPPNHRPADALRRVLVCWHNSREAARAAAEAVPFLEKATKITILVVDPEHKADGNSQPAADIAKHISRYGAPVEVTTAESQGRDVSDVILEQARRTSADLIVMGGYGHSRAREWIIGGATRNTLITSEFPILMAH